MMNEKDLKLISHLRRNSRESINRLPPLIDMPKSTLFDRLRKLEESIIHKHTTIVDFEKIGFNSRNIFIIKADPKKKGVLKDYLGDHPNVNNLYITNSNSDFLVETIFKNQKETNDFMEEILGFTQEVKSHNIIEDVKRESFMSLR